MWLLSSWQKLFKIFSTHALYLWLCPMSPNMVGCLSQPSVPIVMIIRRVGNSKYVCIANCSPFIVGTGCLFVCMSNRLILLQSKTWYYFRTSQYTSGQRVLIAGAITSALRLHQRMPQPRLNREFLNALVKEDSAHYLIYSVIMLYAAQPGSSILYLP